MSRFPVPGHVRVVTLGLTALLVAACSGPGASPTPEPSPPADAQARLRVTVVQALPPSATFGWLPSVVITLDGRVLTGGAVPAIFPGPLVPPILERQLSPNGWSALVAAARTAGLLGAQRDFTGGQMPPGSGATRLEILADGLVYDLIGDAGRVMHCITEPCVPQAGTPEAFAGFINQLSNIESLVGAGELGPTRTYAPAGYALIVGPAPDDQGLPQPAIAWPLAEPLATLGAPVTDGSGNRCGTLTGDDAATVRAAFASANQLTAWRDPDGSLHGLQVRPLLPGDGNPCEGMVAAS